MFSTKIAKLIFLAKTAKSCFFLTSSSSCTNVRCPLSMLGHRVHFLINEVSDLDSAANHARLAVRKRLNPEKALFTCNAMLLVGQATPLICSIFISTSPRLSLTSLPAISSSNPTARKAALTTLFDCTTTSCATLLPRTTRHTTF